MLLERESLPVPAIQIVNPYLPFLDGVYPRIVTAVAPWPANGQGERIPLVDGTEMGIKVQHPL